MPVLYTGKFRAFCRIADTGVGMAEPVRLHIFDPFFTTKREKGKGFGLSGAYAIVDRHGGEITVESEPGKGSLFTVWLPVASEHAEPLPATPRPAAPAAATAAATPKPAQGRRSWSSTIPKRCARYCASCSAVTAISW